MSTESGSAVLDCLMSRRSIRSFTEREPADQVIEKVVRAGQQAPFAMQLCSLILDRDRKTNPFSAPLLFTICVDIHRMELIMARRGWSRESADIAVLVLGVQDAAYFAQNMVIAAEALKMGSCFIGAAPFAADSLAERYSLPRGVFPLVQLVMGYPAEDPPTRPRYPLEFTLFEDRYPVLSDDEVDRAMEKMDEGYLEQDYYRKANYMIPLGDKREESFDFDTYSWTEHISRKLGLWHSDGSKLLEQLDNRGYDISR